MIKILEQKNLESLCDEVGMLMAYEVTRDLQDVEIETPVTTMTTRLAGKISNCTYFKSRIRDDRWCIKLSSSCSCGRTYWFIVILNIKAVEYFAKITSRYR